jgi:hypothetical protein
MATPEDKTSLSVNQIVPMVFRHRMGWLTLAIVPMLLAGLWCLGFGYYLQFISPGSVKPGAGWAMMVMGLLVGGGSAAGITLVWDIILDRANAMVTRRLGVLGRVKVTTYPMETFAEVVVWPGTVRGHRRYKVELWGGKSVYLTEYSSRTQALEKAEEVGRYLDLPVKDHSNS